MTLNELGEQYIQSSEQLLTRIEELRKQSKNKRLSPSCRNNLVERRVSLEELYWETREIGLKLQRDYGPKTKGGV